MINVDPEKLSKMAENLFSPSWGRFFNRVIFLSFLVAVVSGAGLILFDQLIGKVLWPFLTNLIGRPNAGITLDNIESIIILLGVSVAFFVIMFALLVWAAIGTFRRRVVPQHVIDQLATFRDEGISVLNDVPKTDPAKMTGDEKSAFVATWKERWKGWSSRAREFMEKHLTKAEVLSFARLGILEEKRFGIAINPQHAHYLMQLAKQLTILENLIQRHQERH